MAWFDLHSPAPGQALAFSNAEGARQWLGAQSQTVPARMQIVLSEQFEAAVSAALPVADLAPVLETLRNAAVTARTGAAKRFSSQARPLGGEAAALFASSVRLSRALAAAYLECTEKLGGAAERDPRAIAIAAHRAMVTLRHCLEDHYLAGIEVPVRLWKNTHRLMQIAHALGVAGLPLADPEFRDPAETTIAEQYNIIVLSALVDPYSLSGAEFTVARRAFQRWRNLANLAPARDGESKSRWLSLAELPGLPPPPSPQTPQWIELSGVRTKARHRIRALDQGQSPEELQFGRELSARGCREMLDKLVARLKPGGGQPAAGTPRTEQVRLATAFEDCYALIAGKPLKTGTPLSTESSRVTHDRMAIFGIADQAKPIAPQAGEAWTLNAESVEYETLSRPADEGSARLLPGHLLAIHAAGGGATLGVVDRVLVDHEQIVRLRLRRFPGLPQAYSARSAGSGGPLDFILFTLPAIEAIKAPQSVVLPSGIAIRIKQAIFCDNGPGPLHLGELIERGDNFERYAAAKKAKGH